MSLSLLSLIGTAADWSAGCVPIFRLSYARTLDSTGFKIAVVRSGSPRRPPAILNKTRLKVALTLSYAVRSTPRGFVPQKLHQICGGM